MQNKEQNVTEIIRRKIMDNCNFTAMSDIELENKISEYIDEEFAGKYLSLTEKVDIADQVFSLMRGLGVLDSIIHDDDIT